MLLVSSFPGVLSLAVAASGVLAPAGATAHETAGRTVVGRLVHHAGFLSETLGNRRSIWVLLPVDYDGAAPVRYPVLYAFDGQDLFDAATAAGGEEWAIDELLQAQPPGIPPLLVVGIEADPQAMREQAPPGSRPDARGQAFLHFLVHELKPFVDFNYRTLREATNTIVLGEGAGALTAVYAAWAASRTFGGAVALGLPDLDVGAAAWLRSPPPSRPRLWIEQQGSRDAPRSSTTELLSQLETNADVEVVISSPRAARLARLAAGLRQVFSR